MVRARRETTLRADVVVAARAVVLRCTTCRFAVPVVALVAVAVVARALLVRGTTRRLVAMLFVRTTTSIGLFVWVTVVPGFNSVRILFDRYGYIYE